MPYPSDIHDSYDHYYDDEENEPLVDEFDEELDDEEFEDNDDWYYEGGKWDE
jgi:hypothetical protein